MSQISKQALIVDNNQSFPNNNSGQISPSDLRAFNANMIDSLVDELGYRSFTSSVTNSINLLNAFTSSQQPTFNALNQFTASQFAINAGYNSATYSLNVSVNTLNSEVDQLQTWSGSVNQIQSAGVTKGYATRFNFSGLMTASITQNVNGNIADISLVSDNTKVSTSSFNAYTASNDAYFNSAVNNLNQFTSSQITFNNSATASISQLLSFSSSLDTGYVTEAELSAATASLVNQINTKLNTSSFNSYTSSTNTLLTGYATTGSNTFFGSQFLNGQLYVSSSSPTDLIVNGQVFISSSQSGSTTNAKLTISGSATGTTGGTRGASVVINPASVVLTRGGFANTINAISNYINASSSYASYTALGAQSQLVIAAASGISYDNEFSIYADSTGIALQDWDNTTSDYSTWLSIGPNDGATIPKPQFTRGLVSSGSTITTGSVLGNVVPLTISSNTASMDLSKGNFFTLTLVSGSTTRLTTTNVTPGQTINLLITQANPASGSLTYNSTIKFPAGNGYVATAASASKDIITFITFDNSTIYAAAINNLV